MKAIGYRLSTPIGMEAPQGQGLHSVFLTDVSPTSTKTVHTVHIFYIYNLYFYIFIFIYI